MAKYLTICLRIFCLLIKTLKACLILICLLLTYLFSPYIFTYLKGSIYCFACLCYPGAISSVLIGCHGSVFDSALRNELLQALFLRKSVFSGRATQFFVLKAPSGQNLCTAALLLGMGTAPCFSQRDSCTLTGCWEEGKVYNPSFSQLVLPSIELPFYWQAEEGMIGPLACC